MIGRSCLGRGFCTAGGTPILWLLCLLCSHLSCMQAMPSVTLHRTGCWSNFGVAPELTRTSVSFTY